MDINIILLGSINALNNVQLLSSDKEIVQSESSAVLHEEGDTSSEIVQKEVSCYNLKSITTDNVDEILKNSGGKKTFIVIGNKFEDGSGCGKCSAVSNKIKETAQEMSEEANFVELNYNQNKELLKQLKKEVGYDKSLGFPAIIVCDENGNPEKILNDVYYEAQNHYKKSGLTELLRNELGTSEISKQIAEKGTTFIYAHIGTDKSKFNDVAEALGDQAKFLNLDVSGDYSQKRIVEEMLREVGAQNVAMGQYVIKCVDGKPVELIPANSLSQSSKTDTETNIEYFKNKISGQENIETLTSKNADTYLRGTEGTSYVIIGNTGCSNCKLLAPYLSQVASNLGDDANFLELTYSKNKELYDELKKEAGKTGKVTFPVIVKCVNGKATEFIDVSQYTKETGTKDNTIADDITKKLKNKIEGTYKENPNKKLQQASAQNQDEGEENTSLSGNVEAEKVKKEALLAKQKLSVLKENLQRMNIMSSTLANQSEVYNDEVENTEKEIEEKQEEYEQLAKEIEEKQEEYNYLVSKAENSNDESLINEANELGEEINSLIGKLDSIKTEISNLQTDLSLKQNVSNTLNTELKSLSKVQSTLSKEIAATKETQQTNSTLAKSKENISNDNTVKSEDSTDWSKLTVEGKGINVYNLYKLMSNTQETIDQINASKPKSGLCAVPGTEAKYDAASAQNASVASVRRRYESYTDEEKTVIDKFYNAPVDGKTDYQQNTLTLLLNGVEGVKNSFANIAYWDKDGDGFLSDDEVQHIKDLASEGVKKVKGDNTERHYTGYIGGSLYSTQTTMINGEKVYIANDLIFTEAETQKIKEAIEGTKTWKSHPADNTIVMYGDYLDAFRDVMTELGADIKCSSARSCMSELAGSSATYTYNFTSSSGLSSAQISADGAGANYNAHLWCMLNSLINTYNEDHSDA